MTPVATLLSPALLSPALPAPVLSQEQQPPPNAPEFGGSSPIGLVVIVLLFIAMAFLIRSMNKHLRKVPASFDQPEQVETVTGRPESGDADGPVGGDGAPTTQAGTNGEVRDTQK